MRLAIIYSDKRGKYLAGGFRNFCDVVEVDLSKMDLSLVQKVFPAVISFHFNRSDWVNDFYRNPLAVSFRQKNGNKIIASLGEKVDAVLQFGVMNTYDYSLLGTKNVFYYQDGAYDRNSKLWTIKRYENWFSSMQKRAFDQAAGIFTFSNWARQQHINEYFQDEGKVFSVGWGPCLPVENEYFALKRQVRRLLFIGKPGKRKGLHILISAFNEIHEKYSNVVLDVVGVERENVDEAVGPGIFFHGRQSADKVLEFLRQTDLFILPSLYERAGHVTVEAMWYGCPVVVSNTCGAPEPVIAGNCGLVTPVGNAEKLKQAIVTLIENPENVAKLSSNALLEAQKNWSWRSVCGRMVEHMESAKNGFPVK